MFEPEVTKEPERTILKGIIKDADRFIEGIYMNAIDIVFAEYRDGQEHPIVGFQYLTKQGVHAAYWAQGHHSGWKWQPSSRRQLTTLVSTIEKVLAEQGHRIYEGCPYFDDEVKGAAAITFAISDRYTVNRPARTKAAFDAWLSRVRTLQPTTIHCSFDRLNYADDPWVDRGDAAPFTGGYSITADPEGKRVSFYGDTIASAQWLLSKEVRVPMSASDEQSLESAIIGLLAPLKDAGHIIKVNGVK